jgi:hypothetical protein
VVNVGFFHDRQELTGVSRQGFDVAALPFGVDGVKGQRGFVIGNGPSLLMPDLEALKNEITIASNKIFLAFDQTDWRPTYYTIISGIQCEKVGNELGNYFKTVHTKLKLENLVRAREVFGWENIGESGIELDDNEIQRFSDDLTNGAYGGRSVTYEALQFAAHLGLNPIYLIGCDHNYKDQSAKPIGESRIQASLCNDHFHPNYRKEGEAVNPFMADSIDHSFKHARAWAELNGVEIINATRGGHLEVFPRADLDEILGIKA